jgi:hypothetical protein
VPLAARPHLVQVLGLTNAFRPLSAITLLSRGVAHVIDQGLAWSCSTWWSGLVSWFRAGRVSCLAGSWVRS